MLAMPWTHGCQPNCLLAFELCETIRSSAVQAGAQVVGWAYAVNAPPVVVPVQARGFGPDNGRFRSRASLLQRSGNIEEKLKKILEKLVLVVDKIVVKGEQCRLGSTSVDQPWSVMANPYQFVRTVARWSISQNVHYDNRETKKIEREC